MSEHTPGPWEVVDELNIIAADGYNLGGIADASEDEGGRPEEDRANARLIGAAPEMLDTLKSIAHWLSDANVCCFPRNALHAVIEKAEGKS